MVGKQHFGVNSNISEDDEIQRTVHEEINKSSSENEDANSTENQLLKRKRYHRHTAHQIQEMEAFFKDCPHPNNRQRKEISQELGMEPLQVKFWFQNKRTQMKSKHERQENTHLRAENEKLRVENMRYREALNNACCPACGGMATIGDMSHDERHLRIENARLREEIDRISSIAAKYVGKPFTKSEDIPSSSIPHPMDPGVAASGKRVQGKGNDNYETTNAGKP
ncbi:Homeobox-leucine zipper protein ROC2 [Sesamum angolense]|uniref:Homeobox-leucine zipper protein ROC2 n=1 Tax=Sesamum angolense TaxID=2727404 RepID=A0AAE1WR15_9LAMI|nr:Homeobox-leucine zipper protein ROC2 [Sesamum angolense]